MQIHPTVFYTAQILVLVGAVIVVAAISYFVFLSNVEEGVSDSTIKADIVRMQANAEIYYARVQFYDGVCQAIGADRSRNCNESGTAFAIESRLSNGSYYCADSTGKFPVVQSESKGDSTSCIQN